MTGVQTCALPIYSKPKTEVNATPFLCVTSACINADRNYQQALAKAAKFDASANAMDIPSLVVTGGSMQAGSFRNQIRLTASALDQAVRAGTPESELDILEKCVCTSFGACPTMGTANTMQMIGEVLNLVMPGTSVIPATDNAKLRTAMAAGQYAVELTKKDIRPSQLVTKETLENAIMFDTAVAGSTNAILHILAYAYELGIDISLEIGRAHV